MNDPNINNPKLSLDCPAVDSLIADASFDGFQAKADEAAAELKRLRRIIKLHREQDARSQRALASVEAHREKLTVKLCDIRDTLKPYMVAYSDWASMPEAAIRTVLSKNFSVAIPE
jgi:hypothetical protein